MSRIEFVDASSRTFAAVGEVIDQDPEETPTAGHSSIFMRHPGGADAPQLIEVRLPPDLEVSAHAHQVDEIMYVVEGEIQFGRRRFGPGSSISIPRLSLYSFRSGAEGLTFLNFRRVADLGFVSKDELMALRQAGRTSDADGDGSAARTARRGGTS